MASLIRIHCARLNQAFPLVQYIARCSNSSSNGSRDKQKESETKSYNDRYQEIFQNYADFEAKEIKREIMITQQFDKDERNVLEPGTREATSFSIPPTLDEKGSMPNQSKEDLMSERLTHTDDEGQLNMVDVGSKPETIRSAVACSRIHLGSETFQLVRNNNIQKGDVLTVAKIAGIMGAKNTSSLIPLCHPIALSKVAVDLELNEDESAVYIYCTARTQGKTGVEMEALTGAAVAALTVYDMCKAVNREMVIGETRLLKKTGGMRGDYVYRKNGR